MNCLRRPSPDPYADETPAQRDARMQWWGEARFGLFIHWGACAVHAGNLRGEQVPHDGDWFVDNRGVPNAEYTAFARQFTPVTLIETLTTMLLHNTTNKVLFS